MAKAMGSPGALSHLPATLCLSIAVTLRKGGGGVEAPAERALAASPRHTFADLAIAIDEAFGRWELGHRRMFTLADGTRVGEVTDASPGARRMVDYRRARLHQLQGGERFTYAFLHSGDQWLHDCVLIGSIDPDDVLGDRPGHPVCFALEPEVRRSPD